MTTEEIAEAVEQMKRQCDLHMPNYDMVSARSILDELGYNEDQIQAVLLEVADNGFSYCLDHTIYCKSGHFLDEGGKAKYTLPNRDVCYWGPDQLKSRLAFIRIAA